MLATLRSWLARARESLQGRRLAAEQDEELRFHLEMETEENVRRGMTPDHARRAARIAFGGVEHYREEARDTRGISAIEHLLRDGRFALRRLRLAPGFTVGALLTLGIGLGAAVGIGSIVHGVLLAPLPYPHADRLVHVALVTPGDASTGTRHPEATYNHFAQSSRALSALAAYTTRDGVSLSDGDIPEPIALAMVTPKLFEVLEVAPSLGRVFTEREMAHRGDPAVLISHSLWMRRYGGDSALIGRTIQMSLAWPRVVGIMPPGFGFPDGSIDVWFPLWTEFGPPSLANRPFTVVGRLADGADARTAEAELNRLLATLPERFPAITPAMLEESGAGARVTSLQASIVEPVRAQLVLLGIMVGVVLLIAATNVVNLLLLRVERAEREIAIARALGAGTLDVARRHVVEGVTLGMLSLVVALPMATLALATRFGFTAREIPRLHEVSFGPDTTAVLLLSAVAVGVAIGCAAALRALTRRGGEGLQRGTRATPAGPWRRAQQGLVVTQVAMALALIVSSVLMGRSFWNLRTAAFGFEPEGATSFSISLPYGESPYGVYSRYGTQAAFHARAIDALQALPGVTQVAGANHLPLAPDGASSIDMRVRAVDARAIDARGEPLVVETQANVVTPGYFAAMHIPVRNGRAFAAGDLRRPEPGVIVSATLARALFGDVNVVGRRVQYLPTRGSQRIFEIVGVVGDVHAGAIEEGHSPILYFPLFGDADGLPPDSSPIPYGSRNLTYVVRGHPLPAASARAIVAGLDPRIPVMTVTPLTGFVDDATARTRLTLLLLGIAAVAALVLGVVGVYSVLAYAAAGRAREFGVRMALGATPARVATTVLSEGAALAAAGIVAGVVLALAASRVLRTLLYEVSATGVPEYLAAIVLLMAVTFAAIMLPARRAARTDPAVVLRGE